MIKYYKELLYYIKKNIPNKDLAYDITQDTFEKAISFQKEEVIENKRAFLYRLAKNIIIDQSRKNKKVNEITYEENKYTLKSDETEEIVLKQDRQILLMKELKKLPLKRKEAFILHVLEGYSRQEISEIMGISVSSVAKHISRASIELKEKIKEKVS